MDQAGRLTPTVILNADVADGYVLEKRKGQKSFISLVGAHSLWAGSIMLVAGPGMLYRVDGTTLIPIAPLPPIADRINYLEFDGVIFWSNCYANGAYEIATDTARPWGFPLPDSPEVQITDGDLEPGQYSLCFTNSYQHQLSGNGPLTHVSWQGTLQGLQILNLPPGALCWITQPNGGELCLAILDSDGVIRKRHPYVQPLPTLDEAPPPPFAHFAWGNGRIWGAYKNKVYYSAPFRYENYPHLYLPFAEEVIMVAPVTDGIYVNSIKSTWWLNRTSPDKMVSHRIGDGAIPGTLVYAQVRQREIAGNVVSEPLPVWIDGKGIVIGTNIGHIMHMTDHRLQMDPFSEGAAFYRMTKGRPQTIFSLFGPPLGKVNPQIQEIMRRGKLFAS
jgi:hypothetical protein